jgi:hypothetical protein
MEALFSVLGASFVKRQAFKPLNRCAPFKPFKPTSALHVQSSNTLYPAAVKSILDFGFRPTQRSNLKITWRCAALNSSSLLTFPTKAKLPTATPSDDRPSRTDNSSRRAIDGAARSEFDRASPQETFRLPPDCSPAKRTGTTVEFSSSRTGIDNSA